MEKGLLALVLHAHLPFVRHPEYPEFLEEDWLYEAISETYVPLLTVFSNLVKEGARCRVTMTVTPTLAEMLGDQLLQDRYEKHLEKLIDLCEKEVERTKEYPQFQATAQMYFKHFTSVREIFVDRYKKNLLTAFKELQDAGALEIMTCGATHGFLPIILREEAKRAQIQVAKNNYVKHFGRKPRGIWLPECAYNPGDDRLLNEAGIRFFFVDSHSLIFGTPRPRYGIYAPIYTPAGVAAFARDIETSEQVWSSQIGYPGDPDYREFYRDLGYDGDYEYIKPYLHSDGERRNIGIKYYRITGKVDLDQKAPYNPEWATERAAMHAGNFLHNRQKQVEFLMPLLGRKPIIISPYDAELFGHW